MYIKYLPKSTIILMLFTSIIAGCNHNQYSKEVMSSLSNAGENKNELLKVLEQYRINERDSLKYKAACFLISNMKGHFSNHRIEDCPTLIKQSFKYLDSLTEDTYFIKEDTILFQFTDFLHNILDTDDFIPTKAFVDSLIKNLYKNKSNLRSIREKSIKFETEVDSVAQELLTNITSVEQPWGMYPDLMNIKADWLIDHIENAFTCWKESPFAKNISFTEFENTLLTYRSRNEALDVSSKFLKDLFFKIIHSQDSLNLEVAIRRLNFAIYCLDSFEDNGRNLGNLGFYDILQFYKFDCDRHSEWTVRVLNACGIPAYLDYTSGFFTRDKLHYGVSVRDTSGIYLHYTPKWQQLGDYRHQNEFSKVYRRMFTKQKCPMTIGHGLEEIPTIFNNPFMKDVTNEYHDVTNLTIPYGGSLKKNNLGYLAIFMPSGWKPIAWGEVNHNDKTITFQKVPVNATYVAGTYKNKNFIPFSDPFFLKTSGSVLNINPDKPITLHLTRKFPFKFHLKEFMFNMVGAKIQGANHKDFSDAIDLHTITLSDISNFNVKAFPLRIEKKFRYIRCIGNDNNLINVGTFEVFSSPVPNKKIINGSLPYVLANKDTSLIDTTSYTRILGNPIDSSQEVEKAFDGNIETFVTAFSIGMDLGSSQTISQIRFAPRNANNGIVVGDRYELFFYNHGWVSAGSKVAKYNFLNFENVPSKTFYWLRDMDHGKEELSFIYKNGEQIFINNDTISTLY